VRDTLLSLVRFNTVHRYLGHRDSRIINRDRLSGSGGGRGGGGGGAMFEQEDGSDDTEYVPLPHPCFVISCASSSALDH
jgi:hypothetical protein